MSHKILLFLETFFDSGWLESLLPDREERQQQTKSRKIPVLSSSFRFPLLGLWVVVVCLCGKKKRDEERHYPPFLSPRIFFFHFHSKFMLVRKPVESSVSSSSSFSLGSEKNVTQVQCDSRINTGCLMSTPFLSLSVPAGTSGVTLVRVGWVFLFSLSVLSCAFDLRVEKNRQQPFCASVRFLLLLAFFFPVWEDTSRQMSLSYHAALPSLFYTLIFGTSSLFDLWGQLHALPAAYSLILFSGGEPASTKRCASLNFCRPFSCFYPFGTCTRMWDYRVGWGEGNESESLGGRAVYRFVHFSRVDLSFGNRSSLDASQDSEYWPCIWSNQMGTWTWWECFF